MAATLNILLQTFDNFSDYIVMLISNAWFIFL